MNYLPLITLALVAGPAAVAQQPAGVPPALVEPGLCPAHKTAWTYKPAGVSKAGKAYAGFWKCDGKNPDGTYCGAKPDFGWSKSHPAPGSAPATEEW